MLYFMFLFQFFISFQNYILYLLIVILKGLSFKTRFGSLETLVRH